MFLVLVFVCVKWGKERICFRGLLVDGINLVKYSVGVSFGYTLTSIIINSEKGKVGFL